MTATLCASAILLCSFLMDSGFVQAVPLIQDDSEAKIGEFPHQVSLRRNNVHYCGGAIISKNYILTAAMCVVERVEDGGYQCFSATNLSIQAGSNDLLTGGFVVQVDSVRVHEEYGRFLNDLAILKLKHSLIFSDTIQPIALATAEIPMNSTVIVSGWAKINNGNYTTHLQKKMLGSKTLFPKMVCYVWNRVICFSHVVSNGTCMVEPGNPAIYSGNLVGIAGVTTRNCGSPFPEVFANVYFHVDWIRNNSDLEISGE